MIQLSAALTVWASMFTLGLAYHLGGLKGLVRQLSPGLEDVSIYWTS